MAKKEITEEIGKIEGSDLEGTFEQVLKKFQKWKEYYEKKAQGYTNLRLNFRQYNEPYDNNDYHAFFVFGNRYETDQEYDLRLKDQKRYDTFEYKQFLKLQEKFNDYIPEEKV